MHRARRAGALCGMLLVILHHILDKATVEASLLTKNFEASVVVGFCPGLRADVDSVIDSNQNNLLRFENAIHFLYGTQKLNVEKS
jgi:hypothetical protein